MRAFFSSMVTGVSNIRSVDPYDRKERLDLALSSKETKHNFERNYTIHFNRSILSASKRSRFGQSKDLSDLTSVED